mgnify:CR=1 FL=1
MHNQPFAQRVYNAGADAVQTASHFVAGILAAKLAAGMQHGIHNRDSRDAQFGLDIHRDTAAVITDFNDIARLMVTSIWVQYPASASSMALSTIS